VHTYRHDKALSQDLPIGMHCLHGRAIQPVAGDCTRAFKRTRLSRYCRIGEMSVSNL